MPTNSFVSHRIQVHFTLAKGTFGNTENNTKVCSDKLRVHCEIKKGGTPSKNEMKLKIYGLLESDMFDLSTLGLNPLSVRKNLVQVLAGDSDGLATAFQGEITGAWVNYHKPPDLDFEVHAVEGYYPSIAPSRPLTAKGGASVASMFQNLAGQMGVAFQNNGVTTIVQDPYLSGTLYDQAEELALMSQVEFCLDNGVLAIAPKGQPRTPVGQVPYISPDTGMKEYPIWDKEGLVVECLWNSAFQLNGLVVIGGSLVHGANGTWRIHGLEHNLSSHHPHHGTWHSKLHLTKEGA